MDTTEWWTMHKTQARVARKPVPWTRSRSISGSGNQRRRSVGKEFIPQELAAYLSLATSEVVAARTLTPAVP